MRTPHREATLTKGRKVGGRRRAEKKTPHGGEIITREARAAKASGNLGWIGTTTGMTVLMFETEGEHQHCHLQQPGYLLFLFFHGFSVYSFVLTGSPPFRVIFLAAEMGGSADTAFPTRQIFPAPNFRCILISNLSVDNSCMFPTKRRVSADAASGRLAQQKHRLIICQGSRDAQWLTGLATAANTVSAVEWTMRKCATPVASPDVVRAGWV